MPLLRTQRVDVTDLLLAAAHRAEVAVGSPASRAVLIGVPNAKGGERVRVRFVGSARSRTLSAAQIVRVTAAGPYLALESWRRLRAFLLLLVEERRALDDAMARAVAANLRVAVDHFPLRDGACVDCGRAWPCESVRVAAGDFAFTT